MVVKGGYSKQKIICANSLKNFDDFKEWLHETEIWQCPTDLEKKLYLTDKLFKYKESLITKLKHLLTKYINQMTLLAYDGFELLKRSADINIIDFINEFERFHNNMENTTLNLWQK